MKIQIFFTIALTLVLMTYLDSSGNCEVEDREPVFMGYIDGVPYYDIRDTISYTDSIETFLVTRSPLLDSADGFIEYDYDWKVGRNTQGEFEVALSLKEMYTFGNHTQFPIDYEAIMTEFLRNTLTDFNKRFGPSVVHISMPSCWDTSSSIGPGIGAEYEGRTELDSISPFDDMYKTRWQSCEDDCCVYKVYSKIASGQLHIDSIVTVVNEVECMKNLDCMYLCGFLEGPFDNTSLDIPFGLAYFSYPCECKYNNLLSPNAFRPDTVDFNYLNEPYEIRYLARSCDLNSELETIVLQELIAHTSNYAYLDSVLTKAVKYVLNDLALNHIGAFPIERTLQTTKCWAEFGNAPTDTIAAPCGKFCCSHTYLIQEIAQGVYSASPTSYGYSDNFDCDWNYAPCDSNVCDLLYLGGPLPKMNFIRAEKEIENFYSKVIPNPAKDFVKIEYKAPANGSVRLEIYSLNSELMIDLSQNKKSELSYFDFSTAKLATGTYYYKIWVEGINTSIGKFVIKR